MIMRRNGWGWWLLIVSTCLAAAPSTASAQNADLEGGTLRNGLSARAFRRNPITTSKESLETLRNNPLNDDLFALDDARIGRALRSPDGRAVMEELIECALDSTTTVTAKDPSGNAIQWQGEVGLCQEWHTRPLKQSLKCQELVTACVMARVNAAGASIPLSMRSEAPILSPLREEVLTERRFRESPRDENPKEGWPIRSFSARCQGRECRWSSGYVGTCTPGESIQLAIEDPADPAACAWTAIRACAGIHGCLGPGIEQLPDGSPIPTYSRLLAEKAGACRRSPLEFVCPTAEATAGFYSIMTRPRRPLKRAASPDTIVKLKGAGKYPAAEADVFGFPEGAFFGNMFKPEMLALSCTLNDAGTTMECATDQHQVCRFEPNSGDPVGACSADLVAIPYRDVHACYAYAQVLDDDDSGVAALNERLCDAPDAKKCFEFRPRRCHYDNPGMNLQKGAGCDRKGADGAYGHCASPLDPGSAFEWVITTYLNAPCDFVHDNKVCDAIRAPAPPTGGPGTVQPGKRGCGGCSLQGTGALQTAWLAALILLVYRRRMRRRRRALGAGS
jgi:hypothetical protein